MNFTELLSQKYIAKKLNTITKYPSIETYHTIKTRGTLGDELTNGESFKNQDVYITEKIDGTNSRILMYTDHNTDDYIIGDRNTFLTAKNDRVYNNLLSIVDTTLPIAKHIAAHKNHLDPETLYVFYGETYGHGIGANYKQYAINNEHYWRCFDILKIPKSTLDFLLMLPIETLASSRESDSNRFLPVPKFKKMVNELKLEPVYFLTEMNGSDIPISIVDTYKFLSKFSNSNVTLDSEAEGQSEGIVVRTEDRSIIKKLRFEEYKKTLLKIIKEAGKYQELKPELSKK